MRLTRVQEQQIRARQGMKALSARMRANMGAGGASKGGAHPPSQQGGVRILPRDVEQGLKEFASGVEQLVDKLVREQLVTLRRGFRSNLDYRRSPDQVSCPPGIQAARHVYTTRALLCG